MLNSETDEFTSAEHICSQVENPLEKHRTHKSTDPALEEKKRIKHKEMVLDPDL